MRRLTARLAGALLIWFALGTTGFVAQAPETVRVTAARANIRSQPSTKGTILTSVPSGTTLEVRGAQGEWYQVVASVKTVRVIGYIAKSIVTPDKPAATTGPLPASGVAGPSATPARRPAAAMPPGLVVSIDVDGKAQPLSGLASRVVTIARRVDSANEAALAMPIGSGDPLPTSASSQVTYVWVVDDVGALPTFGPRPSIALQFREVPGLNADDVTPVLVRLVGTAAGPRVVSAARGRVDQATREEPDWDLARGWKHEAVKSTVQMTRRGVATVTPAEDLPPGEYAIVLKPTGSKRFAGKSVLSDQEEGRIFGLLWAWRVR